MQGISNPNQGSLNSAHGSYARPLLVNQAEALAGKQMLASVPFTCCQWSAIRFPILWRL